MKKLLFPILLGLVPLLMSSQTYVPMPESDVIWSQNHAGIYCYNQLNLCSDFQYTFGGDTIIGEANYKILNRSGYNYDNNLVPSYFFEYAGGFRQSIEEKKVFFVERNTGQEVLLYDFNLIPGDTIPITYNNQYYFGTIASVDSVLVGNQYRKRFNIEEMGTGATWIIEGIGSNAGLLEPLYQGEDNYGLKCFNLNESIFYPEYWYFCDLITGLNDQKASNYSLQIIPNPISDMAVINISGNIGKNASIEISNIWGEMIKSIPVSGQSSIDINGKEFIPGLYLCVLKSNDDSILQIAKFVVK